MTEARDVLGALPGIDARPGGSRLTARRAWSLAALTLTAAYVAQAALPFEWPAMAALQQRDAYKLVSGLALVVFVLHQLVLSLARFSGARARLGRHARIGAFAPVLLYLHAHRPGYGYLTVLAAVFLANVATGAMRRDLAASPARWLAIAWTIAHVGAAVLLVALAGYHVTVALAYE